MVKMDNHISDPYPILAGVPQGSVLSPLLYTIYCSDFPRPVGNLRGKVCVELFADDVALWTSGTTSVDVQRYLQPMLENIGRWAAKWRVTVNSAKRQAILFKHPNHCRNRFRNPDHISLHLYRSFIPLLPEIKYLGITFDKYLNFKSDMNSTLRKCRNRSNLLMLLRGRIRGCSPATLLFSYNCYIRPVIEYRSLIYTAAKATPYLNCERGILRKIHRLDYTFPSNRLYAWVGSSPITSRMSKLRANYVKRTINGNNTRAQSTLLTPWHGRFRQQRLRRKPVIKFPHPPAVLLAALQDNLPEVYADVLDLTPLSLRS